MNKLGKQIGEYIKAAGDLRRTVREIGGGALGTLASVAVYVAAIALLVLVLLAVVLLVHLIGGLVVLVAWNLGVVNVVAASGGTVDGISYLTAVGASFAFGLLRGLFRSNKGE